MSNVPGLYHYNCCKKMGNKKESARRRRLCSPDKPFKKRRFTFTKHAKVNKVSGEVSIEEENQDDLLEETAPEATTSVSSRKPNDSRVQDVSSSGNNDEDVSQEPHMFIDTTVLKTIISVVGVCPDCDSRELKLCNDLSKKKGLANHIEIRCGSCGYCYSIYTSKEVHRPNTWAKTF